MDFGLIYIFFWKMIEKVMNNSSLEKNDNDSCNGFLYSFASPENLTSVTFQPSVIQSHILEKY